jgi:hypothetical protein
MDLGVRRFHEVPYAARPLRSMVNVSGQTPDSPAVAD